MKWADVPHVVARGSGGVSSTSQPSSVPASKPASSLPPSRTPDPSPQVSRTGASSTPTAVARSPTSTTKSEPVGGTRLSAQDASSPATGSKSNSSSFSLLGLVIGLGLAALAVLLAITVLQTRRARNKKKAEDDAFLRRVVANNMGRRPPPTSTATRSNSAGSQSTPTNRSPASTADRPGAAPSSGQFPPPNNNASDFGPPLYPSAQHQPYPADAQYAQPSLYPAQPPQYDLGVPTALAPAPMPQPNQVYFAESSFSDSHSHLQGHIPHGQYHHHHGSQLPPPPPSHLERPSPAFAQNPRPRRGS
ncbi:hypothetical protein BCR44DRAFT_53309 [Catenaria anguillulae PL171]|uniref:Transmembrane protein n=1 Tax=Catenaria anguillulae PL171 TaxID=765915 RepID=A0A1Y2I1R4_9FUNG|nr:hypothetical protein BCR44DRAFT_53309 [Catenaria anguillulae PL171]